MKAHVTRKALLILEQVVCEAVYQRPEEEQSGQ
eukprot:CAMPEP_0196805974 /NCGR_PEP_ID=MMETSP1362-20130617/5837_1 /TAXON_ID=163516 /ORGANISM="Leptocylindrus danicus, Strain CCMP1856" /LENGTH=32 /DNA_ID= /DNA_START= /DNA_END= /DNA_ORIENTATION=